MEKEFGKLTHDQFAKLVSRLPEVRGQMAELPELMRQKKKVSSMNCLARKTTLGPIRIDRTVLLATPCANRFLQGGIA